MDDELWVWKTDTSTELAKSAAPLMVKKVVHDSVKMFLVYKLKTSSWAKQTDQLILFFNVHAGAKQAMKISKIIIFYKYVQCPQKLVS